MNEEKKSLFPHEEPSLPEKKPHGVKPMNKIHKILAKSGSLVAAIILWTGVKEHINNRKEHGISTLQLQAWERWKPTIIDTTPNTVSTRIAGVITGKKERESTVIINPPGQDPAIQVVTPEATITANNTGEIQSIEPKENTPSNKPITENEAQKTVDSALKEAIEKTIPEEETKKPLTASEDKK